MGLVAKTGRKSPQSVVLLLSIALLLTIGAVTMTVPFLLMLSGSTHTGVDRQSFDLLPDFLWDDEVLYRKYIEGLYNESPATFQAAWEWDDGRFQDVTLLETLDRKAVSDWLEFLQGGEVLRHERFTGFTYCPVSRGRPWNVRRFLQSLYRDSDGSIRTANQTLGTAFQDWNAFRVLPPDTRSRLGVHPDTAWWRAWDRFSEEEAEAWTRGVYNLSGYYHERVVTPQLGKEAVRKALPSQLPEDSGEAERWTLFVRGVVHPGYVRLDEGAAEAWVSYVQARYVDLTTLRNLTGLEVAGWDGVNLPRTYEEGEELKPAWLDWLQGWQDPATGERFEAPLEMVRLVSVDVLWREQRGISPPIRHLDQMRFEEHRSEIRRLFLFQNFGTVWEILFLHGRGLWVTVVYCAGSVLIALIVNPMAAYALSRFRPRNTYALLLYLLLTMAFPPMVTQIPLFLMLRDLHLLNTFWALLLPGMAHGYSIFLLKGFFDSLPRDLYESAALDGAGEMRMFVTITLSLSKPILAVIALSAFVNAYSSFMFALLICQDERMWTLMVWLYQLQQTYGSGVMNAAFVLAALPTLLVFLAAQQQILKGIVIPSEK